MRYLRTQVLNRRSPGDQRLYVDVSNGVIMNTPNNLTLPTGSTSQRPVTAINGMIRYNTDTYEVEVYQGNVGSTPGAWRNLRFKEATQITQQNLGVGDGETYYFGPLSPAYNPLNISSDVTSFGGQNILVVVENVIQLFNTNYTVVSNPTINSETYTPVTTANVLVGSSTFYFSTSIYGTGASGNGSVVTLTFPTRSANPFIVGEYITVTEFNPTIYNGVFQVTAVTTSSVQFNSISYGPMLVGGVITSASAVYPSVNITGAHFSGGTDIVPGSLVSTYTVEPNTGALVSVTINNPTVNATITAGSTMTISADSQTGSGYYLYFSSPVPFGKSVNVLIGFDQ